MTFKGGSYHPFGLATNDLKPSQRLGRWGKGPIPTSSLSTEGKF